MRLHNLYFTLLIFGLLILASCSEDDNNEEASACTSIEKGTKIMPLGASRVQGFPGLFESYRYALWKDLVDGAFDFAGGFGTCDDVGLGFGATSVV